MIKKLVQNLLYKELSYQIHGAAIEVRKDFGPGHKEKLYQAAFSKELKRRRIVFEKERAIKIFSPKDGKFIGLYRPDFIIEDKIIVEMKAEKFVNQDEIKRIYDYLRNSKYELAYFINFASPKLFVKRIIYTNNRKPFAKGLLVSISLILALFSGLETQAAEFSIITSTSTVQVGDQFSVSVLLDPQTEAINATEGRISFPQNDVALINSYETGSIVNLWIQPPRPDGEGSVFWSGLMPGGFSGVLSANYLGAKPGKLFSLILQAKQPGSINFFVSNASALLNDGYGTPASVGSTGANLTILPAASSSKTTLLPELQDTTPPESFTPQVARDPSVFDNRWFVAFNAQDKGTGIDHYSVFESTRQTDIDRISPDDWTLAKSPYLLKDQSLESFIYVQAVDKAGNAKIEILPPTNAPAWYDNLSGLFILILLAGLLVFFVVRKIKYKKYGDSA